MSANRQQQQQQMQQQQSQDRGDLSNVFTRPAAGATIYEEVRMPNGRVGYRPTTMEQFVATNAMRLRS